MKEYLHILTVITAVMLSVNSYGQKAYYTKESAHGHSVMIDVGGVFLQRIENSYHITRDINGFTEEYTMSMMPQKSNCFGIGVMYESPELSMASSSYRNSGLFASLSGGGHYYQDNVVNTFSYFADTVTSKGYSGDADIKAHLLAVKGFVNINWHFIAQFNWQNSLGYEGRMVLSQKYYPYSTTVPETFNPGFQMGHSLMYHTALEFNLFPLFFRLGAYIPLVTFSKKNPHQAIEPGGYNPAGTRAYSAYLSIGVDFGRTKYGRKRRNAGTRRQNWR